MVAVLYMPNSGLEMLAVEILIAVVGTRQGSPLSFFS